MLRRVELEARERGRSLLNAEAVWSHAAGPEGAGEPAPEFARSRGFALGLGDVKRVLELPVPDALLDDLASEAAPHHAAYTVRSWEGPVPDELVEGWARLSASLMIEAPTGEVEREAEHADPSVVRESEALLARQGRRKYNTVALDEHGTVVAYTDIATTVHEPGRAYQWGTLVRSDARGRRLGLAVKVANLRLLQERRPDVTALTTYNAEVNHHMVGVNERLGFVPVARLGEFQKRLAERQDPDPFAADERVERVDGSEVGHPVPAGSAVDDVGGVVVVGARCCRRRAPARTRSAPSLRPMESFAGAADDEVPVVGGGVVELGGDPVGEAVGAGAAVDACRRRPAGERVVPATAREGGRRRPSRGRCRRPVRAEDARSAPPGPAVEHGPARRPRAACRRRPGRGRRRCRPPARMSVGAVACRAARRSPLVPRIVAASAAGRRQQHRGRRDRESQSSHVVPLFLCALTLDAGRGRAVGAKVTGHEEAGPRRRLGDGPSAAGPRFLSGGMTRGLLSPTSACRVAQEFAELASESSVSETVLVSTRRAVGERSPCRRGGRSGSSRPGSRSR